MPMSKEQEILEKQRQLAARFNRSSTTSASSTYPNHVAPPPTTTTAIKPRPPPPPPKNKTTVASMQSTNKTNASTTKTILSMTGQKRVIDLTTIKTSVSEPNTSVPKKGSGINVATKRPTLKRPNTNKTVTTAALLAAARAKASTDESKKSNNTSDFLTDNKDIKNKSSDDIPSPKLKRKKIDASQVGDDTTKKSLASLIAKSSKENIIGSGSDIDLDDTSTLPIHNPDDFWKNMRDWDVISDYNSQCRQQQAQNLQNKIINQSNNNRKNNDGGESDKDDDNMKNNSSSNGTNQTIPPSRKPLPDTFLNVRHYVAAWAPLCLAECRAQLLQELVGHNMPKPILCSVENTSKTTSHYKGRGGGGGYGNNRGNNSDAPWLEENETGGYLIIHPKEQFIPKDYHNIMANDMFLLVHVKYKDILQQITHNNAPNTVNGRDIDDYNAYSGISLVAHAENSRKEINGLIIKVSKRKWITMGQSDMYIYKIGSNVTALREFTALCNVDTLPMKSFLLGQQFDKHHHHKNKNNNKSHMMINNTIDSNELLQMLGGNEKLGRGFIDYAKQKFNSSQLTAIAASAHEYGEGGFTLIKGPPGTGKTTTLVAVLNSLHIRQYNKYYEEVRRIATKTTGSREHALASARRAKPRLLVCAPSNAAVDNIILKIMEDGFVDGKGQKYFPSMIRVGVGQGVAVRAVALETKVENIFSEHLDAGQLQNSIAGYQSELTRISQEISNLRRRLTAIELAAPWPLSRDWEIRVDDDTFDLTGQVYYVNHKEKITTYEQPPPPEPGDTQFPATSMPEYRAFVARVVKLVENYFSIKTSLERCTIVKGSLESGANQMDVRMNLETHVLNSMHMVMTTLGTAGNRTLEAADKFEVIVVDEAAQSVEPSCLAALRLGSRHAVLVGDPQQLPATIFNVTGRNSKYDRSLFQRLEEAGQPCYMLNEQYRMHPMISHFPRHIFYGGALLDGPNVIQPNYGNPLREIICKNIPTFQPLMILDLDSTEERGGTSLSNLAEAKLAVYLYEKLKLITQGLSSSTKVAVISPYSQQTKLLRRSFTDALGPNYESFVEVNTVDAFQGREANIVIFSAVRAAGSKGIGFLSDVRRMNVALTRAKFFLFVIARVESIIVNPYWKDLVEHARENNAVVRVPMSGSWNRTVFGDIHSWQLERPFSNPMNSSEPAHDDMQHISNSQRQQAVLSQVPPPSAGFAPSFIPEQNQQPLHPFSSFSFPGQTIDFPPQPSHDQPAFYPSQIHNYGHQSNPIDMFNTPLPPLPLQTNNNFMVYHDQPPPPPPPPIVVPVVPPPPPPDRGYYLPSQPFNGNK